MIYNASRGGSVSESKDFDKTAKKYTDISSGSSSELTTAIANAKAGRIVVRDLAQVRVVNGRLETITKK